MKITYSFRWILLSFVLMVGSLVAIDDQSNNGSSAIEVATKPPNPLDIEPNWLSYFEIKGEELEKRIQEVKDELKNFDSHLKNSEIEKSQKSLHKFYSSLNSIALLNKQEVKSPSIKWLPKDSYSLEDYMEISDRIRILKLEINYKRTELERLIYSLDEAYQAYHNLYASYLTLDEYSKEKFFQGVEVMRLGARLLLMDTKVLFTEDLITIDEKLLDRYRQEREQIDTKVQLDVNQEKLNEEVTILQKALDDVQKKHLELEAEAIKIYIEENGRQKSRLLNQQLNQVQLTEALLKAKIYLEQAKATLYLALNSEQEVDFNRDIEPIKSFIANERSQLYSWEEIVTTEIDLLSQLLVKVNGTTKFEEDSQEFSASLKMALSNRALLDALKNRLFHIRLLTGLIDQQIVERETVVDQLTYYYQNFWLWFSESFGVWIYYSLFDIGGVPITVAGLFKAFVIVLFSIWLSHLLGLTMKRLGKNKKKGGEPALYTFRRVLHYLILLIGILVALASLGLTMRNMAIVLGAVGLGVGLGLQNIVNNFLCGLAILFGRNVKVGDFVELESGFLGRITEVNVQNTTLHTFDGLDVLVPNSVLIASNVVNWTKGDPFQRIHVPFGVAYGTDQAKVSEVVCDVAKNVPYTMRASEGVSDPEVWLVAFGDSALNFELVVWVNIFKSRGRKAMKAEYLGEIELALKEHGISIPFPQRDLHIKNLPGKSNSIVENSHV